MGNAPSKIPLKFGGGSKNFNSGWGDIWVQPGDARRAECGYAADIFMEDLLENLLEPSVDTGAGGCWREGMSAAGRGGRGRGTAEVGSAGKQASALTFTGSQHCHDGDAEA